MPSTDGYPYYRLEATPSAGGGNTAVEVHFRQSDAYVDETAIIQAVQTQIAGMAGISQVTSVKVQVVESSSWGQ